MMTRHFTSHEPLPDTTSATGQPLYRLSGRGIALAVVGACLFSTKPIIIRFTYGWPIDAVTLMTLRMAFSLPFYLLFALLAVHQRRKMHIKTRLSSQTLARTAIIGIVGYYIASYLDLYGLTMVTAQFERLILFTYPAFVILLGAMFFKRPIDPRFPGSLILTWAGLAIIFGQDLKLFGTDIITGAACILGAALSFAGYILFSQFEIEKLGSRLFTCLAMIAASIAILVHFAVTRSPEMLLQPLPVYGLTFLIAVLATVIPSFLIAAAIEEIGSGQTALLSAIGPVFTTVLGIGLLGEPFTIWHLAGMVLVIYGALHLSQKRPVL